MPVGLVPVKLLKPQGDGSLGNKTTTIPSRKNKDAGSRGIYKDIMKKGSPPV